MMERILLWCLTPKATTRRISECGGTSTRDVVLAHTRQHTIDLLSCRNGRRDPHPERMGKPLSPPTPGSPWRVVVWSVDCFPCFVCVRVLRDYW